MRDDGLVRATILMTPDLKNRVREELRKQDLRSPYQGVRFLIAEALAARARRHVGRQPTAEEREHAGEGD